MIYNQISSFILTMPYTLIKMIQHYDFTSNYGTWERLYLIIAPITKNNKLVHFIIQVIPHYLILINSRNTRLRRDFSRRPGEWRPRRPFPAALGGGKRKINKFFFSFSIPPPKAAQNGRPKRGAQAAVPLEGERNPAEGGYFASVYSNT